MRVCGHAGLRVCGLAGLRVCGLAGLRACGLAVLRACGLAGGGSEDRWSVTNNKREKNSIEYKMITIRKATRDDAPSIIAFQQAMAMETEGLELNRDKVTMGVISLFLGSDSGKYYVAEENGKVVASLMITYEWSDWRNANVWWIQSVYVIPAYRRKGIFRKMYEHVKRDGIEQGASGLRLYVDSANILAQKTYEALGMNGVHYKMYEWMV